MESTTRLSLSLEIGQPLQGVGCARGKQNYSCAIRTPRRIVCGAVENGRVACRVTDGHSFGHLLRLDWWCEGEMNVLHRRKDTQIRAISMCTRAAHACGG